MKQLKMGLIGLNSRGWSLGHLWRQPEGRSRIVAGCDAFDEAFDKFRENVKEEVFLTHDIDALLAREDVDAVAIMSPDFTHEEYAVKAFAAGKHVFCEKPMAITVEGCDRMLNAWKKSGKKFMIGFNMRYMNDTRVMKAIIDEGMIGEVKTAWCRHFVSSGGNWYFHDWHAEQEKSTGLLLQKASHDIDMIHWLTGKYTVRTAAFGGRLYFGGDKSDTLRCGDCPDSDACVEKNHVAKNVNRRDLCCFRKSVDVEDVSSMLMELEGGVQGFYAQCHFAATGWRNYVLIGDLGQVENTLDGKVVVTFNRKSKRWMNLAEKAEFDIVKPQGTHGGADPIIAKEFVDYVLDDIAPTVTPLDGRMSVAAGVMATMSLRNGGRPMDIPPIG